MKRWALIGILAAGLVAAGLGQYPKAAPSGAQFAAAAHLGVWTGDSYAYILFSPDPQNRDVVLVDAGSDPQAQALIDALAQRQRLPTDVVAIWLTHGHIDHCAGAPSFPRATVYVSPADVRLARGEVANRAPLARLLTRLRPRAPPLIAVQMVLPGMQLHDAGLTADVISLPGHTPGSVAFAVDGTVFVGDSLRLGAPDPWRVWPLWLSESPRDNLRALPRLQDVKPCRYVADGHFGQAPCYRGTGQTATTAGNG